MSGYAEEQGTYSSTVAQAREDVKSRRIRPIYEALDMHNYKQALKLCNSTLQKDPTSTMLKALRAVALERLGRHEEALMLCTEVKDTVPTDETVLSTLCIVYNSTNRQEEGVEVHERACKAQPQNEQLGMALFFSHIRTRNFARAQQVAMKLLRTFKQQKYYYWQATHCTAESPALRLAETMIRRNISEASEKNETVVRLLVDILMQQRKHQEALEVLQSDLGKGFGLEDGRIKQQAEILVMLKEWQRAQHCYETLIRSFSCDDWSFWIGWFDCMERMMEGGDEQQVDTCITAARTLVDDMSTQEKTVTKNPRRGAFLAVLEFEKRLGSWIPSARIATIERIQELLLEYFGRFGSKSICFSDMKPYLGCIPTDQRPAFYERLVCVAHALPDEATKAQRVANISQRLLLARVKRALGFHTHLSVEERCTLVNEFMSSYLEALPLNEGLERKERGYGDDFAVLACLVLLDSVDRWDDPNASVLYHVTALLEYAIAHSTSNYTLRILIIRLYILLGALSPACGHYNTLEVKHIQSETVAFLLGRDVLRLGFWEEAQVLQEDLETFHRSSEMATPDYARRAFMHGNYHVVKDFFATFDRLCRSYNIALGRAEAVMLGLRDSMGTITETHAYLEEHMEELMDHSDSALQHLTHNDDRSLLASCCQGTDEGNGEDNSMSLFASYEGITEFKLLWLRYRLLVPKILLWCMEGRLELITSGVEDIEATAVSLGTILGIDRVIVEHVKMQGIVFRLARSFAEAVVIFGEGNTCEEEMPCHVPLLTRQLNDLHDSLTQCVARAVKGLTEGFSRASLYRLSFLALDSLPSVVLLTHVWIKALPSQRKTKRMGENNASAIGELRALLRRLTSYVTTELPRSLGNDTQSMQNEEGMVLVTGRREAHMESLLFFQSEAGTKALQCVRQGVQRSVALSLKKLCATINHLSTRLHK